MSVIAYDKWLKEDQLNVFWERVDASMCVTGPKNVSWVASCVCNPPQYVGLKMMHAAHKSWVADHGVNAQYEHLRNIWYFERDDEAMLFDLTFSY